MRKREATSPPRSGYPFSRPPRHEGGAHMPDDRCRLGSDDVVIGLDLASAEHQAVLLTAAGQRLTRFRIPHSRAGLEELLQRTTPAALGRAGGARVFAFEATGHLWEACSRSLRRPHTCGPFPAWAGPAWPGSSRTSGPSPNTTTADSSSSWRARILRAAIAARRSATGSE